MPARGDRLNYCPVLVHKTGESLLSFFLSPRFIEVQQLLYVYHFIQDKLNHFGGHLIIDERTYTLTDQIEFSEISGDYNPIHLDSTKARRENFGAVVVQGIHALSNSLEAYFEQRGLATPVEVKSLEARFTRAIYLDRQTVLIVEKEEAEHVRLKVSDSRDQELLAIKLQYAAADPHDSKSLSVEPPRELPQGLGFRDLENYFGHFNLAIAEASSVLRWPTLAMVLGMSSLADLVSLTRMVGMKCPCLHSIFAGVKLTVSPKPGGDFRFEVISCDQRFSRAIVSFQAGLYSGEVEVFFRPPPQAQISFTRARELVSDNEFVHQNVWIVGGSRGLGEATAKLVSAGGGHSTVTYYQGDEDANRIRQEIQCERGSCAISQMDII